MSESKNYLASQLLAYTLQRLFPNVLLVGGGVDSVGFYFDVVLEAPLTDSMLELVEVHFRALIKEEKEIHFLNMMRENAQNLFMHQHQPLLAYQVGNEALNIVELVKIESFYGLCPTASLQSTQDIGHIKLIDQKQVMQCVEAQEYLVTRVSGVRKPTSRDLKSYLKAYELYLKKKDHRLLGPRLNLFSFFEQSSQFGVLWHPKGELVRQLIQQWLAKQLPWDQHLVSTPSVLWHEKNLGYSGSNELENFSIENKNFYLRASPFLQHLKLFQHLSINLDNGPYRLTEWTTVYQPCLEKKRWGLFNSRSYLTDFTTIACRHDQVLPELISSLQFIEQIIRIFDFDAQWYLTTSRKKTRQRVRALQWLNEAVLSASLSTPVHIQENEEVGDDESFLELHIKDFIGREWPTSTIRLKLSTSDEGASFSELPIYLTRQILGSIDALTCWLIEFYEGDMPLWLAPEQVRVLAIGKAHRNYAAHVHSCLEQRGMRASLDVSENKLGARVHEAEKEAVPYLVLVGDQEKAKNGITVRPRHDKNEFFGLEAFVEKIYSQSLCPVINCQNI